MNKYFLVLDFGSQYTHLIKTTFSKLGYESKIVPGDERLENWSKSNDSNLIAGLVFSGGASSVYDGTVSFDKNWLSVKLPILGICYGHQLIAGSTGSIVEKSKAEFGQSNLKIVTPDPVFEGVPVTSSVWMSHRDSVTSLTADYRALASSDYSAVAAFKKQGAPVYGLQFHPEVSHTEYGTKILDNYCRLVCNVQSGDRWNAAAFVEKGVDQIKAFVGDSKVIFGLSGGVDSLTMSVLLRKAIEKDNLLAVYIDTGLMPDETLGEVKQFCDKQDIPLFIKDASQDFFNVLSGIADPTQKGKAIGKKFIDLFEEIAMNSGADIFAQGTIWSDVVESGVTKFSSQIKPHHNVGGLPEKLNFKLFEPLRELFKDQVRAVATELQLPEWVVKRKVFPGPGFAIRVQGIVTPEKVALVRRATKIVEDAIYGSGVKDDIWMAFAILVDVPSLGVRGDERVENEHAMVIRIVESQNSMTAQFSRKALPYLEKISKRITDELEVGRVVYDITDKPPATIEWQ